MPSFADAKLSFLEAKTGKTGSIHDLEFEYYSSLSGLTPKERYSIADHRRAYLETEIGESDKPISRLFERFLDQQNITGRTLRDRLFTYYLNPPPPAPSNLNPILVWTHNGHEGTLTVVDNKITFSSPTNGGSTVRAWGRMTLGTNAGKWVTLFSWAWWEGMTEYGGPSVKTISPTHLDAKPDLLGAAVLDPATGYETPTWGSVPWGHTD